MFKVGRLNVCNKIQCYVPLYYNVHNIVFCSHYSDVVHNMC